MAKTNKSKSKTAASPTTPPVRPTPYTLPSLRANKDLWYQLLVLIYDLHHPKDKPSEARTLQTTDALYISGPYFSVEEAEAIKSTIVDDTPTATTTLETAISQKLENFFEKRRASGDSRPCGPHDLGPVYLQCLGIEKEEIGEERFVSRVRRSLLGK